MVEMPQDENGIRPLALVEREVIEAAIAACGGNVPRAAARLEISASTIYRKKMAWDSPDTP
jgi:DNA-binding NtrC family response regulator